MWRRLADPSEDWGGGERRSCGSGAERTGGGIGEVCRRRILSAMEGESISSGGGSEAGGGAGNAGTGHVPRRRSIGHRNRDSAVAGSGGGGGYQGVLRGGGGDRGGRNRFGGRGGRNRPGGRGGSGGGGGRPGGDRRFGRELPSSKYAVVVFVGISCGRWVGGQTGPEGHISMVLPGESLAKFRRSRRVRSIRRPVRNLAASR